MRVTSSTRKWKRRLAAGCRRSAPPTGFAVARSALRPDYLAVGVRVREVASRPGGASERRSSVQRVRAARAGFRAHVLINTRPPRRHWLFGWCQATPPLAIAIAIAIATATASAGFHLAAATDRTPPIPQYKYAPLASRAFHSPLRIDIIPIRLYSNLRCFLSRQPCITMFQYYKVRSTPLASVHFYASLFKLNSLDQCVPLHLHSLLKKYCT